MTLPSAIISLDFSEKVYILTFEEHSGVCKYLTIYFRHVYSISIAAKCNSQMFVRICNRNSSFIKPIFASSILIYKELGWESLAERRKRRNLQMFYNIQNNNAPMYLCDLIEMDLSYSIDV
jgi:hypothetical protein